MVWIAIVLATFLFYKFVERSHKIIFFKTVGVCIVLCALIATGVFLYERLKPDERVRADITVEYSSHSSKLDKEVKKKIAERLFLQMVKESYLLGDFSNDQLLVAKQFFFSFYIDGLKALDPISKADPDEINFLVESWSDDEAKSKAARLKYQEIHKKRIERYISELPDQRNRLGNNVDRRNFAFILAARVNSIDDDRKGEFEKHLTKEELEQVRNIQNERNNQAELIIQEFNRLKPDTEISFKVCNKEDKPLNSYSFYVSGYDKGRSSAKDLRFEGYGDDTRFEGDIIIPPRQCSDINWTGKYRMFNRYQIKLVNGVWAETN